MKKHFAALLCCLIAGYGFAQQSVTSFSLMNADTDLPIAAYDPLVDGAEFDLAALPTRNLNIRANTSPYPVGSLRFGYDGNANYQLENGEPYALAKDTAGDYWPWTPTVGSHTLTATPYTAASGGGTAGTPLTINFTVTDSGSGGGGGGGSGSSGSGAWVESGGIVVIEPEHGELISDWVNRPTDFTTDPSMAGSLVDGWLEWTGAQYSGNTISESAANAVITYNFNIETEGDYIFRWRSKQYNVGTFDSGNDTFVRFASGTTPAGYQDFSSFTKVWVQSKDAWSWNTTFEPVHGTHYQAGNARRHFTAGNHSIQLAARSPGHSIDRIVLHHTSVAFNAANFESADESARTGGPTTLVYQATSDFPVINSGEVPYYVDADRNALAINAANVSYRDKFARAQVTFDGPEDTYDVTITSLRELDGECTYRFLVNGTVVGTAQNSTTGTDYNPQNHLFQDIVIPAGATIAVESNTDSNGQVPENGGFAWARGRWTTLTLTTDTGNVNTGEDPVADAGVDKAVVLPSSSVVLTGSGTDDGSIASYAWAQTSGPNSADLSGFDTDTLTASNLVEGSYVFTLTVTDDEGNTGSDDVIVTVTTANTAGVLITGELRQWHKVTLTLDGPTASEGGTPNPFTDYRMDVTFTHPDSGLSYVVPSYFAADGNAADSGAAGGNKWRAHLAPDHTGQWDYVVSFRSGGNVAVGAAGGGTAVAPYDGKGGSFMVIESDKDANDFRTKGRLVLDGTRYLKHASSGTAFVKTGADAPENFLSYNEFDNTYTHGTSYIKSWGPHVGDWASGDPTWSSGKGKGIIGAINYLASEGQNVFSFLTYNAGGDSKDVWPFVSHTDPLRYDCSKLDQWEIVFEHGQNKGMYLHFKTQETENDNNNQWALDNGDVGTERKLYYRELIARFGHHLALNWNLGEENTQTEAQEKAMAQYFYDNDPYHHNIVLHTYPGEHYRYDWHYGAQSKLTGASIQTAYGNVHSATLTQINNSTAAGKPWIVANDEQGPANGANPPDDGWPGYSGNNTPSQRQMRSNVVWGNLMAGGAGVELYAGYNNPESDLTLQDFRSRNRMWDYCRHAKYFFNNHLPFSTMVNANGLIGNSGNNNTKYCFANTDSVYAIYLANGGTTTLNLSAATGQFVVKWFDPRDGGDLLDSNVTTVNGGGSVSIGNPPNNTSQDWAVLVCRAGQEYNGENRRTTPIVSAGSDKTIVLPVNSVVLNGTASDNGSIAAYAWTQVSGPSTATLSGTNTATLTASDLVAGTYVFRLTATDDEDNSQSDTVNVTVKVNTIPDITTTTLPNGKVTVSYSEAVARTSGDAPFSWSVAAGALPNGLSLGSDGTISGTPTTISTNTFTVRVEDQQGDSDEQALTIIIDPEPNTETFEFNPTDDAYLESGTLNNNTLLKIENGRRVAYMKFDVAGLSGDLVSATLSMKVSTDGGNGTINFFKGSHNNWTESDLSSATAPAKGATVGTMSGSYAVGSVYTVDVTPLIAGQGDGTYSLIAEMAAGGNDAWFSSSEGGFSPTLEVVMDHGIIIGHRPVVDAGQDISLTLPDNEATLGGSASDHEGAVTIQWSQTDGPNNATLTGDTTETLTASGLIAGTYTFEMAATDTDGNTSRDSANVSVSDPSPPAGTGAWIENGGLLVMEAEHVELTSSWVARPTTHGAANAMAGSLGSGWLEWTGGQYSGNQIEDSAATAILTFTFQIQTAGDYNFRWRGKQYDNVPSGDAGNDTFVQLQSGTTIVTDWDPTKFTKVWIQSQAAWSWQTNFEPTHGVHKSNAAVKHHYEPGTHTIRLAARSPGHSIDRIVLHHSTVPFNATSFDSAPESARVGDGDHGIIVSAGTDQTLLLPETQTELVGSATDDGSISSVEWTQVSGPGTAVMTGATQTNVTVSSMMAGTYVFRLTATDNEANTAYDEVEVTVTGQWSVFSDDFSSAAYATSLNGENWNPKWQGTSDQQNLHTGNGSVAVLDTTIAGENHHTPCQHGFALVDDGQYAVMGSDFRYTHLAGGDATNGFDLGVFGLLFSAVDNWWAGPNKMFTLSNHGDGLGVQGEPVTNVVSHAALSVDTAAGGISDWLRLEWKVERGAATYQGTPTILDSDGNVLYTGPQMDLGFTNGAAIFGGYGTGGDGGNAPGTNIASYARISEVHMDNFDLTVYAPNYAPMFTSDPVAAGAVEATALYTGDLNDFAIDPNGDVLIFNKDSGPAWLNVVSNGTMSGTPAPTDIGTNTFMVSVEDPEGESDSATLNIVVLSPPPPLLRTVIWSEDFEGAAIGATSAYNQTLPGTDVQTANKMTSRVVSAPAGFTNASGNVMLLSTDDSKWSGIRAVADPIDLTGYEIGAGDRYKLSLDIYIPTTLSFHVGGILFRWHDAANTSNGPFDWTQAVSAAGQHRLEFTGTFPVDSGAGGFIPDNVKPIIYFHQDGAIAADHVYVDNIVFEIGPTPASVMPSYTAWAGAVGLTESNSDPTLDIDGDGLTNMEEYLAGTDPGDQGDVLAVESIQTIDTDTQQIVVEWESKENRVYSINQSPDLIFGEYEALAGGIVYPQNSYTVDVNQTTGFIQVEVELK